MKRIFPQLAKSVDATDFGPFIKDDGWVMEQKLDGHRIFLSSPNAMGDYPSATTRNGTQYTRRLPTAMANYAFPPGDWLLDGELVGDQFWVFDMPYAGSMDLTAEPLVRRRLVLENIFPALNSPFRLVPQAKTREQKITLADRALREGYEGVMVKRAQSPYRSAGRTEEWLKIKFVDTVDVIVTDVRGDGKDSVGYAIHENGMLKQIGRASLIGKEKNGVINVGDVIEVRYLYVGADGRLYQPTIIRKRDDKLPVECTGDQLRHVNKSVLEAL